MFDGNEGFYSAYGGPRGPGVYLNDAAANTNTANGVDGTVGNPVSTIGAAKTIADSMSLDRLYLVNNSEVTLVATMTDYEFIGIGEVTGNVINLGSQDVSRSAFYNITIEGTQGGSGRIDCVDCALQDPGVGDTTLHIFGHQCGIVDRIQLDTSADNVLDQCFSLVAGTAAPIIQATGAAGTIAVRHFSGGIEFESLSASHNLFVETDGQVIFAEDCNVNATVALRGMMTITDDTAGMSALIREAAVNRTDLIGGAYALNTTASGNVGIDWANVENPTTALDLSATDIQLCDTTTAVTNGVTLANGAITDASLAGNMEIVFETDFATNYNATRNAWVTNAQDFVGTTAADPFNGQIVAASVTGNVGGNVTGSVGALTSAAITDVWSTDTLTEAYTTDGADGTPAQILYDILQSLTEFSIASTTLTVKQRDGSTTAATYTLDSDTTPTSRTRAT
jgi:hypothetical protein